MADLASVVAEISAVSPAGSQHPSAAELLRLSELTDLLIETDPGAVQEYERFVAIGRRHLELTRARTALVSQYAGKRVLVTGATGCIGSSLVRRLVALGASSIVGVSRGVTGYLPVEGVRYVEADVRDETALLGAFRDARPEVVFHLAAQRTPGLAEKAVIDTVETNVLGTLNVLSAARAEDVDLLCHASTGKAMRYYTADVYAGTKKLAEWLLHDYMTEGRRAGGARFTHVVDNSIVLSNFRSALAGGMLRVHDPAIEFYVQSAAESAELLMLSGLAGPGRLAAIRDLDAPVRLLAMAVGLASSADPHPPIWVTGYDQGYENGMQPGLYDPRTASDLSPLINALEADTARECALAPEVDTFSLLIDGCGAAERTARSLEKLCRSGDTVRVQQALRPAVERMAHAAYRAADPVTLERVRKLAERSGRHLPCTQVPGRRAA